MIKRWVEMSVGSEMHIRLHSSYYNNLYTLRSAAYDYYLRTVIISS